MDWAEGHACSPSDMAAPRIASWASRKGAAAADGRCVQWLGLRGLGAAPCPLNGGGAKQ